MSIEDPAEGPVLRRIVGMLGGRGREGPPLPRRWRNQRLCASPEGPESFTQDGDEANLMRESPLPTLLRRQPDVAGGNRSPITEVSKPRSEGLSPPGMSGADQQNRQRGPQSSGA